MQSFRRTYIDRWLQDATPLISGKVIDIGGKKEQKRGSFRPEATPASEWHYLNTDPETAPDLLADATNIPAENNSYDTALLCEVLEHIEHPEQTLAEITRILKPGGRCFLTVPFLMPVHADPSDYCRPTLTKLKHMLQEAGLTIEEADTMGGLFSTISDILRYSYTHKGQQFTRQSKLAMKLLFKLSRKLQFLDEHSPCGTAHTTTGYGIIAIKPSEHE